MPRNRPELDREKKVAEILNAAERRLRRGGYEELSVASIARELGLAQNAIYWYFPSKDHLFVSALGQMLTKIMARKPSESVDVIERILWFSDQLPSIYAHRGAMYEQARTSEVVAQFVENLNSLLRHMLSNALTPYFSENDLPIAVDAFTATVEGAYLRDLKRADRRQLLKFALDRLIPADSS